MIRNSVVPTSLDKFGVVVFVHGSDFSGQVQDQARDRMNLDRLVRAMAYLQENPERVFLCQPARAVLDRD